MRNRTTPPTGRRAAAPLGRDIAPRISGACQVVSRTSYRRVKVAACALLTVIDDDDDSLAQLAPPTRWRCGGAFATARCRGDRGGGRRSRQQLRRKLRAPGPDLARLGRLFGHEYRHAIVELRAINGDDGSFQHLGHRLETWHRGVGAIAPVHLHCRRRGWRRCFEPPRMLLIWYQRRAACTYISMVRMLRTLQPLDAAPSKLFLQPVVVRRRHTSSTLR